jgi:ABC-2 type transport system ATP-binding protein
MLAGLIQPSGGSATVLGFRPGRRDRAYLGQMALVMGNRNQLGWDLPALDSFELNRAIYDIPRAEFLATRDGLIELLDLGDLVQKPVRNLSLGERMKVEIAASLLHRPKVLFLDEPTIGLDLTMQRRIRRFIRDYNQQFGATVLLTSHYMADVEALCERVIVIDRGLLRYDGRLDALATRFAGQKRLRVSLEEGAQVTNERLAEYGEVLESEAGRFTLGLPREAVARVTARLLTELPVADLSIAEASIEDVIQALFDEGQEAPPG